MEGCPINHKRPTLLATILVTLLVVVLAACSGGNRSGTTRARPTPLPTPTPLPPLPTEPPPGSEQNPIVFMLVNVKDAKSLASKADDLTKTLSDESNLVIQVKVVDNYGDALSALCSGEADVISAQAFAYLSAQERKCGNGVYIAKSKGKLSTQGEMVTLGGRDIFSVKGFGGYRFCRPDPESVNGWIVAGFSMRKNGVNPLTDLYSVTDTGSDEGVIQALLDLKCDVGAAALGAESSVKNSRDIVVLEKLPPVPNDTIMLTTQLDGRTLQKVQDLLDNHKDDLIKLIGADDLDTSDDTAFDQLRQLMSDAGVDAASMGK